MDTSAQASQSLNPGGVVVLYELDLNPLGLAQILRFTQSPDNPTPSQPFPPVTFDGNDYAPIPITADGFGRAGDSAPPRPKLSVSLIDPTVLALIKDNRFFEGALITRFRVFERFLDGKPDADPSQVFSRDTFIIDRVSMLNTATVVTWELRAFSDLEHKRVPARQVIRDHCDRVYRAWDGNKFVYQDGGCPYRGTQYFDIHGIRVTNPQDDRASKHIETCCKKRFGSQGPLPFGGFPGANRY